jgi:hypothetical protein
MCCPNGCHDGSTCVDVDQGYNLGWCNPPTKPSCGGANAACTSSSNCCTGLVCQGGHCQQSSTGKTCGGQPIGSSTLIYRVGVQDPGSKCVLVIVSVVANSPTEAGGCVRPSYPGYTLLTMGDGGTYEFALYSDVTGLCNDTQVVSDSQSNAEACAQYQCTNCTVAAGACP